MQTHGHWLRPDFRPGESEQPEKGATQLLLFNDLKKNELATVRRYAAFLDALKKNELATVFLTL